MIAVELCYLGWRESLALLAQLAEAETLTEQYPHAGWLSIPTDSIKSTLMRLAYFTKALT